MNQMDTSFEFPSQSYDRDGREEEATAENAVSTTVNDYPLTTVLTTFGIGLGVGVVVGSWLAGSTSSSSQHTVERFGSQMLDSISSIMPDALTDRFKS